MTPVPTPPAGYQSPAPQGSGDAKNNPGKNQQKRRRRKPASSQQGTKPQGKNTNRQRATQKGSASAQAQQLRGTGSKKKSGSTNKNNHKNGNNFASHRNGTSRKNAQNAIASQTSMPVSNETSAGGLVLSGMRQAVKPNNKVDLSKIYVALIGRMDRRGRLLWSMPKGHVEDGEGINLTAEREVWEETGITGTVFAPLGTIDYWFVSEGTRIHKTVHHHLLDYVDGILNDEDPEVTEVAWVPVNHLIERLAYADERKLAREALKRIPNLARAHVAQDPTPIR